MRERITQFAQRINLMIISGRTISFTVSFMNETFTGTLKEIAVEQASSAINEQINLSIILERRRYIFKNVFEIYINEESGEELKATLDVKYLLGDKPFENRIILSE